MDDRSGLDGTNQDDHRTEGPAPGTDVVGPGVVGTVQRSAGVGMAGAVITITDLSGTQQGRAVTDERGDYRVAVSTGGTYLVVAGSGAFAPHASMVAIADRPVRHDIVLAGSSGVYGTVRDSSGAPLAAALVTLIDVRGDVVATTVPDEAGRYHLDGLATGRYTLTVSAEGHQPVAGTVDVDGHPIEHDVTMPGRSGLAGTAIAGSGGHLVAGAVATLIDADGRTVATSVTGPDGRFSFGDLPAGSYTLTASGHAPVVTVVQVGTGRTTAVDVEFPEPGRPIADEARGSEQMNGGPAR